MDCTHDRTVFLNNIVLIIIYGLINSLFFYKYSGLPYLPALLYLCLVTGFAVLILRLKGAKAASFLRFNRWIYFAVVFMMAVLLTLLMMHYDPKPIHGGRYPAIYDWITRLIHGDFPYGSSSAPSGLPFLFILAMPFYFLGNLGLIQIISFLIFCVLIYFRYKNNTLSRFRVLLLLVSAPAFLYEVVVRSELFSNMAAAMSYLAVFEAYNRKAGLLMFILLGIAGGLVLSTRVIVFVIYLPFFIFFFIRQKQFLRYSLFALSMGISFILTLVPFIFWDFHKFMDYGPFSIQMSYLPAWVSVLFLVLLVYLAWRVKHLRSLYTWIAVMLFVIVVTSFIIAIVKHGWYSCVFQDRFDISYFCFTLPFLLISLRFLDEHNNGQGVFV